MPKLPMTQVPSPGVRSVAGNPNPPEPFLSALFTCNATTWERGQNLGKICRKFSVGSIR